MLQRTLQSIWVARFVSYPEGFTASKWTATWNGCTSQYVAELSNRRKDSRSAEDDGAAFTRNEILHDQGLLPWGLRQPFFGRTQRNETLR